MVEIERNKKSEYQFTAYIDFYLEFPSYLGSYKRAFDILIEHLVSSATRADSICYPLLFLARHCMELGLKTNIKYFSKYSEKNDFTIVGGHDLEKLFGAFKMHVKETFKNLKSKYQIEIDPDDKKSFEKLMKEVEKLNSTFHKLDKSSDAFRYPIDKKQNPSFEKGERINIIDVNELLNKSMILFIHTSDVFSKYTDYADEIENHYEQLMNEQYY